MLRIWIAALLALVLALPTQADETPADPSPTAMAFAGQFSDAHLSGMLSRIGARQAPLVALSQLNGDLVALVFDTQIDLAVDKYGPEWQRNMALSWGGLMEDNELQSLMDAGSQSPFAPRYAELTGDAGRQMQALSGDLFAQILSEVLDATVAELTPEETN